MSTSFPFVQIPKELEPVLGVPKIGTHIYRRDGSQEESAAWFDLLTEVVGPTLSPGGVAVYCSVSRAAVYKRIQDGNLSILLFHVTHRVTTMFGKNKLARDNPYGYVPVSEAQAWRADIEERAKKQGYVTEAELDDAEPGWYADFLEWRDSKGRRGPSPPSDVTLRELAYLIAGSLMGKKHISVPAKGGGKKHRRK